MAPVVQTTPPARVRVLVAPNAAWAEAWTDWQAARLASSWAMRIGLAKAPKGGPEGAFHAAAVGGEESLTWFSPVDSPAARRLVIAHAERILAEGPDISPSAALAALVWPRPSSSTCSTATTGIVLFSHAETDLLTLDRARARLPGRFPPVTGYSLIGLDTAEAWLACLGPVRARTLVVVARVHGRADTVGGLREIAACARREGWGFIAISGVDDADPALSRLSSVSPETLATTAAYFMAGGVENVHQALRFLAHVALGLPPDYLPPRPMPAHGLYHPDLLITSAEEWLAHRVPARPVALVIIYRAHVLSGNLAFADALVRALEAQGFAAAVAYTASLRDNDATGQPAALTLLPVKPTVVVNTLGFPRFLLSSVEPTTTPACPFTAADAPWLQAIVCGTPRDTWLASVRGLNPTETTVNVALPECDGRILTVPISFKENHRYQPDLPRIDHVARLAARFATLRRKANAEKRIAIILTNASGKAHKIGSAVGLDTPASLVRTLRALSDAGYHTGPIPADGDTLFARLLAAGCYDETYPLSGHTPFALSRRDYLDWFSAQPEGFRQMLVDAWGAPSTHGPTVAPVRWAAAGKRPRDQLLPLAHEPHTDDDRYLFAGIAFGHVFIGLQPPRGFGVDPDAVYHAPDLAPTHHYAAFYRWLDAGWRADALIHFGKHGTLEWLPGKAVALSESCAPAALLGDLPLFYPFVVNDPGEGAQAKRRAHAVILDHLVPPLTHAETYGPLAALARLVEEYYRAEALDPAKLPLLQSQIWQLVRDARLEDDLRELRRQRHGDHTHEWDERPGESGAPRSLERLSGRAMAHLLEDLDAYLCDLGRAQIRDGLHRYGQAPEGTTLVDLLFATLRCPNGETPSLLDAVAIARGIDPAALPRERGAVREAVDHSARELLRHLFQSESETLGEQAALALVLPEATYHGDRAPLRAVLRFARDTLAPALARTPDEMTNLLHGLSGGFVPAGPSGAPSRGMAHVLPTGRNFYTVDPRGLPSPAAWTVGQGLAREALDRYREDSGALPENVALSVWGTATMRTGGDDIAQALALIGARPLWHTETRRTTGVALVPLVELGRPRIDVTVRVSGFFRDAFPQLMQLVDDAVRLAIQADESPADNYLRKHWLADTARLVGDGIDEPEARRRAGYRVFSSKPGAYGTGLLELIEHRNWKTTADLARAFVTWGGWAYGADTLEGVDATALFQHRLGTVDLALHNQDNREHDLFDSDDYFQFHGGLVATISALSGRAPRAYFGDSSDPAHPEVRTLQGEALRVFRSRVVNPKWQEAIRRHGYKGGLEVAATVDYLFGYSATAGIVTDWMYHEVTENYTKGETHAFLQRSNPWALHAIAERLLEAADRGLWSAGAEDLTHLRTVFLESEAVLEAPGSPSP